MGYTRLEFPNPVFSYTSNARWGAAVRRPVASLHSCSRTGPQLPRPRPRLSGPTHSRNFHHVLSKWLSIPATAHPNPQQGTHCVPCSEPPPQVPPTL